MSRKAKMAIPLPKGVEVLEERRVVTVKGPKGTLSLTVDCPHVRITVGAEGVALSLVEGEEKSKNFLGLYWALVANMVKGVTESFSKDLEMIGVGFRAAVQGSLLDLQLGFSHPVKLPIPSGIQVKVEKNTLITVTGVDKRLVGQFCADIRAKRPPEPYKGKGIRYKGEYVRHKAGKAGKK